jgi:hypothetical protein
MYSADTLESELTCETTTLLLVTEEARFSGAPRQLSAPTLAASQAESIAVPGFGHCQENATNVN